MYVGPNKLLWIKQPPNSGNLSITDCLSVPKVSAVERSHCITNPRRHWQIFIISELHYNHVHFPSRIGTGSHECIHYNIMQKFTIRDFCTRTFHCPLQCVATQQCACVLSPPVCHNTTVCLCTVPSSVSQHNSVLVYRPLQCVTTQQCACVLSPPVCRNTTVCLCTVPSSVSQHNSVLVYCPLQCVATQQCVCVLSGVRFQASLFSLGNL
jgi:hypothetical protein